MFITVITIQFGCAAVEKENKNNTDSIKAVQKQYPDAQQDVSPNPSRLFCPNFFILQNDQ